jgi:hypothetical protein
MNQLDNDCFKCVIDYLQIQEYMTIISLSKHINMIVCKYKKQKHPFIIVYNGAYGGYGLSSACYEEIKRIRETNSLVFHQTGESSKKYIIQAILNIGSKKASGKYCSLELHAVPWMFRDSIKIDEYDGSESISIDYNKYRYNALEKIKAKIDKIDDSKEKEILELKLFRKLLRKHEFLNNCHHRDDKHMEMFNDRLDQLIHSNDE